MATDLRREIELERWRLLGMQLEKLVGTISVQGGSINASMAEISKLSKAVEGLTAEIAQVKAEQMRHPIRQLWDAFLAADWRGKLVFLLPPSLMLYAWFGGQPLPSLLKNLLETAHLCATGVPNVAP